MGNIGTLALGLLLIVGVLFIGYKMDVAAQRSAENKPQNRGTKAKKLPRRDVEVISDREESDIYTKENLSDSPYESDEDEYYENDNVNQNDFDEDEEYEEDDINFFNSTEPEENFNNNFDEGISFNPNIMGGPQEEENVEDLEEGAFEEEIGEASDSTMVFDTSKLNTDLDELEKMDHVEDMEAGVQEFGKEDSLPEESFSEEVPLDGLESKLKELDEEDVKDTEDDNNSKSFFEGPLQKEADDATSFMNELNKYKETAEAEEFSGFAVETKSEELKETHKKYTKRKSVDEIEIETPNIPFTAEESKSTSSSGGFDFLAQMEQSLKQNQKERDSKKTATTKKTTKKKSE